MKIEKGHFSVVKDTLSLEMGLSKVDAAKRIVSGFATIDNIDLQGDVVEFDASIKAFERSRRNVREMHQPIAVGKVVSYEPKEYIDNETGELYKGVYVSVYVSTGAEDTWQKVLDGTLSAFSIKGPVRKSVSELRPGADAPVRVIKDYDLEELSLVDSGGNQFANVISIQKNADGQTEVSGLATGIETKNVFWCKKDQVSIMSADETETCPDGHDMARIGWIESGDPDSVRKVREMIAVFDNTSKEEATEGGVTDMGDVEKAEGTEEVVETEVPVETEEVSTEVVEEVAPEEVESAEEVSEVPDDEDEISKINKTVSDLEKRIDTGLEESKIAIHEAIERIEKSISESREEHESKLEAFEKRYDEMKKSLEDISGKFESVSKSVEALDNSSALKKSNDLGGSEAATGGNSGGLWNNAIL